MPDDVLAPLSADELATIEAASAEIDRSRFSAVEWEGKSISIMAAGDDFAEHLATIANALPRLLAQAQREAALRAAITDASEALGALYTDQLHGDGPPLLAHGLLPWNGPIHVIDRVLRDALEPAHD